MNCKKCGNLLEPTDTFCKNCGESVVAIPDTSANTNNNVVSNSAPSGMTFMSPPTEPTTNNQVQNAEVQNVSPNPIPTPVPVQPVSLEQNINNSNLTQQPVTPMPIENQTNNNQASMPLNQGVVSPLGGATINQQPTTVEQQPSVQPIQNTLQPNNISQTQPVGATMQDEPTEPVKKKSSPILIVVLVIVLLAVVGYEVIYFVKPFDKKNNNAAPNNENQEVLTPEENNNNYANWMNYLLDQNITSIILERIPLEGEKETAPLINDNLSDIFSKLNNYQLIKRYYEGAGIADGDILTIAYTKDDISYEVKITNGILWADSDSLKDDELRNILEESEYITENEELKDKDGAFYNYVFDNYDNTIFDEYFVTEKIEETE